MTERRPHGEPGSRQHDPRHEQESHGHPSHSQLDAQQSELGRVADSDFRARSLNELVSQYLVPGSVLDVGCGSGGMLAWLLAQGYDASGIDSSDHVIESAQRYLSARGRDPERVRRASIEEVVRERTRVDNVLSMDCLEHQADERPMFSSLVQALRPGGRLVVTVPAVPLLFSERDRIYGHYRRYTREQLRALCAAEPLRIEDLRYWNLLGVPPTFVYAHVLKRTIDEGFRYGNPTLSRQLLRTGLSFWFRNVENKLRPPVGLTLILVATRLNEREH